MLYRKYRPQNFAELRGLDHIRGVLTTQLAQNNLGHAYLFHGGRGTGKTTTARLIAKSLFCLNRERGYEPCGACVSCGAVSAGTHIDLIEIDAASNRGIDDIRSLREAVHLAPSQSAWKVYIIDEVHMLTKEAFNALLKTLEEPPPHVVFILCTTELHKVPATVISRCQHFTFTQASPETLVGKLKVIVQSEKGKVQESVLESIALRAMGGFRDAENLLEQILHSDNATTTEWLEAHSSPALLYVQAIISQQPKEAITQIANYSKTGGDLELLVHEVLTILRYLLLVRTETLPEGLTIPPEMSDWVNINARNIPEARIMLMITEFTQLSPRNHIRGGDVAMLEVATIKLCHQVVEQELVLDVMSKTEVVVEPAEVVSTEEVAQIESKWPEILAAVRPYNHSIEALLRSCRPLSYDGEVLLIETLYQFHKERLTTPTNLRVLQKTVAEVLGTNVTVSFHMGDRPVEASESEEKLKKDLNLPPVSKSTNLLKEKVASSEASLTGLDIFSTEIL